MVPQAALHGKEDPGDPERETCMQGYKVKFITLSQLGYHSQKYIGTKARS